MPYDATWDDQSDVDQEVGVATGEYVPPSLYPPPMPMGTYKVEGVPDKFVLSDTGNGNIFVKNGQVQVVEGDFAGKKADAFISAKPQAWRKDGTDMDDFLRGVGLIPANGLRFTKAEIGDGVTNTWGNIRKAYITHEGYCSNCRRVVARGKKDSKKNMDDGKPYTIGFERNGRMLSSVTCPHCGASVEARAKVQQWYPSA